LSQEHETVRFLLAYLGLIYILLVVDCVVSNWFNEGMCSATCGGGRQLQRRSIIANPTFNGAACPALTQYVPCNSNACVTCTGGREFTTCARATEPTCSVPYPYNENICFGSACQCPTSTVLSAGQCIPREFCPPPPGMVQLIPFIPVYWNWIHVRF
jgi:hypothetical protein